jgi:hypothetical protein
MLATNAVVVTNRVAETGEGDWEEGQLRHADAAAGVERFYRVRIAE